MAGYRYYKLTITDFRRSGSQVNYASAQEVNLLDSDGTDVSRVSGATYSANSYYNSSQSPAKAFDGSTSTIWHSNWSGSPSYTNWIKVSLPEPKEVYTLILTHGNGSFADFPAAFTLSGSNDDVAYTELLSVTGLTSGWSMSTPREFQIAPLFEKRYLIRSGATLYTLTDGALSALDATELTSQLFLDSGFEDTPDGALLTGLTDPEVLYWHDADDDLPSISITVTGVPPSPQVLISDTQDMSHGTVLGIGGATATASDDVLFAVTFDDGATWKKYDGSQWVDVSSEADGMAASVLNAISSSAWSEVATSTTYKFRFVLPSETSYITSVVIDYLN